MKCSTVTFVILGGIVLQACTLKSSSDNIELSKNVNTSSDSKPNSIRRVELGKVVEEPIELIAKDLVNALSQALSVISPQKSAIKLLRRESLLDDAIKEALENKGYKVEVVRTGLDPTALSASVVPDNKLDVQTHVVRLGNIFLRRSYAVQNNKVTPMSSLFIRGVDSRSIQLDDRIFLPNNYNLDGLVLDSDLIDATSDDKQTTKSEIISQSKQATMEVQTTGEDQSLYLCTPQSKQTEDDGWVCSADKSEKQWVDATTLAGLINRGIPARPLDWNTLRNKPDGVILRHEFYSLGRGLKKGSLYLCSPEGKGDGTDGWLCRVGESGRQWISPDERAQLMKVGTPELYTDWASLMEMPEVRLIR